MLENILVLAVAQEASRDETKPKVVNAVTLEVTPEQAEKLDLARSVGTLSLVLRNQVDPKPVQTAGSTKATLLSASGVKPHVTAAKAAPVTAAKPVKSARTEGAGTAEACRRATALRDGDHRHRGLARVLLNPGTRPPTQ